MSAVQYREDELEEFRCNPCIEALKAPREPDQVIQDLMIFPSTLKTKEKICCQQKIADTESGQAPPASVQGNGN